MILFYIFFLVLVDFLVIRYSLEKIDIVNSFKKYFQSLKRLFKKRFLLKASELDKVSKNGIKLLISILFLITPYFFLYFVLMINLKLGLFYSLLISTFPYLFVFIKKKN